MHGTARSHRLAAALTAMMAAALLAPAGASAATKVFGSPLTAQPSLNTAENLAYPGVNTMVPVSPEAPNGVFHTFHFGADSALWNTAKQSVVPEGGQIVKVRLEGCAKAAPGGPAPLTEVHFQDLSPLPGGGARVNLTSQGFNIPVCGQGGSPSTVSTYEPVNLCASAGDYVAFNDDGGYVENIYRNGVPYQVLGAVKGAAMDSFIANDGTGDGAALPASDLNAMEGFRANPNVELMLQMVLGTGSDARYVCHGGTKDAPPVLPVIHIRPQTDGVTHERIIEVAIYCRPTAGCNGSATLTDSALGHAARLAGHTAFTLHGDSTGHVPMRISSQLMDQIRRRGGVTSTFTAVVNGKTFAQPVVIKIL